MERSFYFFTRSVIRDWFMVSGIYLSQQKDRKLKFDKKVDSTNEGLSFIMLR
jgi:hypothetical protein